MVWPKFYPSKLPLFAVCYALNLLPVLYLVATSYDHVQPFVPFLSSLGIYPPEKYLFTCTIGLYGVMVIFSQLFWSSMMRRKFKQTTHSRIGQYVCNFISLVYIISGICIVLLSIFNMKDNNLIHYRLTMVNFFCHVTAMILSSVLVFSVYRPMKWFLIARIIVILQLFLGSYFFVYFNRAGLLVFDGQNIYYIKEHERGYYEFNKCAISEWFCIFSIIEITWITGLELRNHEQNSTKRKTVYMA
uniref:CWH43-like N-terminal domain-containing protein n=1 Tax=Schistosoma mansoni TaxID=6183 RepID=A0A5K4FAU5_SCHMA